MNGKSLVRTRDGRIIAGVCSGVAAYTGVDANIIRLLMVIFTIFAGSGVLIYLAAWLLIPEEGQSASILQNMINKQQ
jgi:phage shock protein PspC (stress-responsive transcriptional regulator)